MGNIHKYSWLFRSTALYYIVFNFPK